jgi:ADP-heptose:LPS heptosyltransferase
MKNIIERVILRYVLFLYKLANIGLDWFRYLIFLGTKTPKDVKRILVFRVGNIGDVICAFPAISAIRENYPKAEILLLSSPGNRNFNGARELSGGLTVIDKFLLYGNDDINSFKKLFVLFNMLRSKKCDLFIELPTNLTKFRFEFRNIIFARSIGCKYGLGFNISSIKIFSKIQSKYMNFESEEERLIDILKKENIKINKISFNCYISKENKEKVNKLLNKLGSNSLVAFNPNAKKQINIIDLNKFAEIGRELVSKYNVKIAVLGGNSDRERGNKLSGLIGEKAVCIAGKLDLLQTVEFLKYCKLIISVDSGAIHLASAAGIKSIGLYSAREFKGKWYPYGKGNIVFRKEPECHTCFKYLCKEEICLNMISVEEVVEAAGKILINQKIKKND